MKSFAKILLALLLFFGFFSLNLNAEEKKAGPDDTCAHKQTIGLAVEFTAHSACAHIAKHQGWFEKEGLRFRTYESYITGMALAAALARGSIDAAYICLIPAINAYANAGVPIKIVAGVHQYGYGLVVNPDKIKTVKDLEKPNIRIGCLQEGSPPDVLLHKMIEKYHLDQAKLLRKTRRMNSPQQFLSLKGGELDAAFFPEQYPTMAEELGFKVLLTAQDLWANMPGSVLVVRENLIRDRPEVVKKLVKLTEKATRWLNSHPESAAQITASELSMMSETIFPIEAAKTAAILEVTPRAMMISLTKRLFNTTEVFPREIQATIDYMATLGYIKQSFIAEKILDMRWLHHE